MGQLLGDLVLCAGLQLRSHHLSNRHVQPAPRHEHYRLGNRPDTRHLFAVLATGALGAKDTSLELIPVLSAGNSPEPAPA